jgi:glycosyltransferase involved in cell wall biosynthesis
MPPVEAMKCGCVPVTLRHSSLPEVMGEAGVMLEREDADQAVREIRAQEGPAALERLRQAGYAQAGRFSWSATAGAMREIYDSLV